jgi:hypothetical protein
VTPADRRALAAALRHGRTHYAFRCWGAGFLTGNTYCWYRRPFDGRDEPVLRATDMGGGQWVLTWPSGSSSVDSVGFVLSVLAFFGVYQPEMAEVAG